MIANSFISHFWKCRAQSMAHSLVPAVRPGSLAQGMSFSQFFEWKRDLRRCDVVGGLVTTDASSRSTIREDELMAEKGW